MAWSTPNTWNTGDVPTAAQMNQDLRDNPLFLYTAFTDEVMQTQTGATNVFTGTANTAYLSLIVVPRSITVTDIGFRIGTQSGNMDIGVYNTSYTRLWSWGSFTTPAAGAQTKAISGGSPTSLTLTPGLYWMALAFDNGTATAAGTNSAMTGQSIRKASSFALPSSITTPSNNTDQLCPIMTLIS